MIASRILSLLCALTIGLIAFSPTACAAGPPVWQPYREVVSSPLPNAPLPAQYVVEVPPGIPVDALTDAELDHLSTGCCTDSFTIVNSQVDPVIGMHWTSDRSVAHASGGGLEVLPGDLLWHSYWAGAKEPRTSGVIFREMNSHSSLFDVSLGGRVSVLRYGHRQNSKPLGWELQIEGAAQLRLNLDQNFDFDSADFRFGVPLIYAPNEQHHWKFAYYHLSSHVGDEFLDRNPGFMRINYSRDVLVFGTSYFPRPAWRWYAETGWAFYDDEGSDPWEFQFGLDLAQPGPTGTYGTPFFAINGHLREEVDFGGNLVVQAGWLWRGQTGRVLRTGLHYYNGKSPQFEFFDQFEQQIGFGIWQEY